MALKFIAAAAATAVLALSASAANATVFAGNWQLTTYENADPGLVLNVQNLSSSNFSVDLGATDPQSINLFNLYTNETSVNPDDQTISPISLKFTFTAPTPNNGPIIIGGSTQGYAEFFGIVQGGKLTWQNGGQAQLTYGNNLSGLMTLGVNGGTFNEGLFGLDEGKKQGLKVQATFDWDHDPTAVPEPATWALMIGGFGMAGATLRRRRALTA
jgi:hypothetical protein